MEWKHFLVPPEEIMAKIRPGMTIFLGSGVAEPRTLINCLAESGLSNTNDLGLVQLTSHSDFFSLRKVDWKRFHLTTFFSSWVASEAVVAGSVDLIPARISQIPRIVRSRRIPLDVALIQITPPNEEGYCSLGMAVDVAREAMDQASLVVGEINPQAPFTYGDTLVSVSNFDFLIESTDPPSYFKRPPVSKVLDQVAFNISQLIEDGDCLNFSIGPLFEALGKHLINKRDLGIHSSCFTDALMDLVKSGSVSNYRKTTFRGKSVASYALGTPALMAWLSHNPLIEFQGVEQVLDPIQIGRNAHFVPVFLAKKVDLRGRVAFSMAKRSITSGPGQAADLISGAEISRGGRTVFGLPSRNQRGEPNILLSLRDTRNQFYMRESIDFIVTEYGAANLRWRTLRERAQALIDIAHPDDRQRLVEEARQRGLLFKDQIFISDSARFYPLSMATEQIFKDGLKVRFRPIRPSDEEAMRRLFYRFSVKSVYHRFLYPISVMPHEKIQHYVNVDYAREMSVVAIVGGADTETLIAEARFVKDEQTNYGDLAFIVDEKYHGRGIATYLYELLAGFAKEQGLKGLTAQVLETNRPMMKVFEKSQWPPTQTRLENGLYKLIVSFAKTPSQAG